MRLLFILLITLMLFMVIGCNNQLKSDLTYHKYEKIIDNAKPLAFGADNDVYVFCDKSVWKIIEPALRKSIERNLFIVYNEKYFNLIPAEIKDLEQLSKYRNLIFIGDLETSESVSEHMRSSLPGNYIDRIKQSGGELFIKNNVWVRDQLIMYLYATNQENLLKLLSFQIDNIFTGLLNRYTQRIAYQTYLSQIIDPSFFKPYPFSLKIPNNYQLFSNDANNRFLSFLYRAHVQNREIPDKILSVYYENMVDNKVDLDWMLKKRKELAWKYYDQDEFNPADLRSEKFVFNKHQGWRIVGAWKNLKHSIGGGFQSFAFYDARTKRAYLIDNSVFFPAGDKLPILLELFMISTSLEIK